VKTPEPRHWAREMGYTPAEFEQVLVRAFADWRVQAEGTGRWRLAAPDGEVSVAVEIDARAPRRLGALVLPVLAVSLAVHGGDGKALTGFLARFERSFQKGGG
jgi:hypothetical protein